MRTLLTLFLLTGTAATVFSQVSIAVTRDTVPAPKKQPFGKAPADAFLKKLPKVSTPGFKTPPVNPNAKRMDSLMDFFNSYQRKQLSIDRMPNAIAVQPFPSANSVYKGNNGEGFAIYEATIDRMPILMPDSTNAATLKLPKIFRKPKK